MFGEEELSVAEAQNKKEAKYLAAEQALKNLREKDIESQVAAKKCLIITDNIVWEGGVDCINQNLDSAGGWMDLADHAMYSIRTIIIIIIISG